VTLLSCRPVGTAKTLPDTIGAGRISPLLGLARSTNPGDFAWVGLKIARGT
jgi:hypothetical protein